METLRKLAHLPPEKFWPTQHGAGALHYIRAKSFLYGNPTFIAQSENQSSLLTNVQLPEDKDVRASLTLICIPRDDNEIIKVDHETFLEIFDAFGIDARFLHLIQHNRYGLHYERSGTRSSYYIATVLYTIMWSFDSTAHKTCAILLLRDSNGFSTGWNAYEEFRRILELEATKLHTPFLLAWVTLVHLSNWVDLVTYAELTSIRQLEDITGHGPYGGIKLDGDFRIDDLTQASKEVGTILVDLANQSRHIVIGSTIAAYLLAARELDDLGSYVQDQQAELQSFLAAVPSVQRSLADSKEYVSYLQERARNQASVIVALTTHVDARINIKLAHASTELAAAAKRDSSSMKTIAIMTMLFLPGTFFAALWAVPSLQWDEPGVIQDNFWVYWAFTAPSTVVVFLMWFGLNHWRDLSTSLYKRRKRDRDPRWTLPAALNNQETCTLEGY